MDMLGVRFGFTAIFLSLFLFGSCSLFDWADDKANDGPIDKTILLRLVNEVRATGCDCGGEQMPAVSPLAWNSMLEKAALDHSRDMDQNNFFSHTGSNGSTVGERVTKAGFVWRSCGENIAKGYPTEEAVVQGWINSAGHCKNIMNPGFTLMGIAKSGDYWTQVFASN